MVGLALAKAIRTDANSDTTKSLRAQFQALGNTPPSKRALNTPPRTAVSTGSTAAPNVKQEVDEDEYEEVETTQQWYARIAAAQKVSTTHGAEVLCAESTL